MNLRAPLPVQRSDTLAALCKASGDPLRLNVLRALANDSFGVLELAQIFDIGQSGMSHHLKVLAQADLVATRREGNAIFYRRALPHSLRLGGRCTWRCSKKSTTWPCRRRAGAHRPGATTPRGHQPGLLPARGRKFRAQQDLIAGLPQYRESLLALLDKLSFAGCQRAGSRPRRWRFLPDLARRFAQVTAWTTARPCSNWRARCASAKAG
jgi:ArsR family transcriptional regulator